MTAIAPVTSSHRKYRLPCLVMPPSRSLPPVVCCLGTNPIQAARSRPEPEHLPVADLGNEGSGDYRADARDLLQPPARLARAMPGQDALLDGSELGADSAVLPRQHLENAAGDRGNPAIRPIRDDPEQLAGPVAPLRRHNAKFGQVPSHGIAQHRALTHQHLTGPVQHQGSLLRLRLERDEPHRRPRDRFADRFSIVRVVLAALEVGLYVARRHQPHGMAERFQLAAPVMVSRTGFASHHTRRQIGEKCQYFGPTNALADYHRARAIDPVHLEHRLRYIKTDRDNLAHGRLPSMWRALPQPLYGTSMPESGRRPQHQSGTMNLGPRYLALVRLRSG